MRFLFSFLPTRTIHIMFHRTHTISRLNTKTPLLIYYIYINNLYIYFIFFFFFFFFFFFIFKKKYLPVSKVIPLPTQAMDLVFLELVYCKIIKAGGNLEPFPTP